MGSKFLKAKDLLKPTKYSTHCKTLDELFGGYEAGGVIHLVYGVTMAGKTTLATYIPIMSISKYFYENIGKLPSHSCFIVIDTDGGFSPQRLEQILKANNLPSDEILDRVLIYRPIEFSEQHTFITKELPDMIKSKNIKPLLISLDPAIAIYRHIVLTTPAQYLADTIRQYTGKLDAQLVVLRAIGSRFNSVVTVTSWTRSIVGKILGAESEVAMIGGREMGFLPKTILFLDIIKKSEEELTPYRIAVLYKHREKELGKQVIFKLSDRGVEDLTPDEMKKVQEMLTQRKVLEEVKKKRRKR